MKAPNSARHITVVMAGGGGSIGFLKKALGRPFVVAQQSVPVHIVEPVAGNEQLNFHGASLGRLAVALGGANLSYDNLVHEFAKLAQFPSLGAPKQPILSHTTKLSNPPAAGQKLSLEELRKAREADDWLRSLTELKKQADAGDSSAQFRVAKELTSRGRENDREAAQWYVLAARLGHIAAQVSLGVHYATGRGVPKSLSEAWAWWSIAAAANQPEAIKHLAVLEKRMSLREKSAAEAILAELKRRYGLGRPTA